MYIFFYCYFLMCYFDMYVETQVCTCDYMGDVEVIIYVFFYCHFLMCYFDTYVETQVCTCDLSFYILYFVPIPAGCGTVPVPSSAKAAVPGRDRTLIISGSGGGSSCGLLWCSWSLHKKSITSQHHHYCMLYEQLLRIHKNDTDD
jgi:hypothetical protein